MTRVARSLRLLRPLMTKRNSKSCYNVHVYNVTEGLKTVADPGVDLTGAWTLSTKKKGETLAFVPLWAAPPPPISGTVSV